MKFEVIPILQEMEMLYQQPKSIERFRKYISTLQGDTTDDLVLPIGGFNPMGKKHVLQKLKELKDLGAEQLMHDTLENFIVDGEEGSTIKVVLNLADDLKGAWTNQHTTDFDNKFKINALVNRNFCTPYFWTSEHYTEAIIKERTLEAVFRTIYWKQYPKPKTLEEHLNQEIYVSKNVHTYLNLKEQIGYDLIHKFYVKNKNEDEYSLLFNFFYGDVASQSLNYPMYGISNLNGFQYAKIIAEKMGL